MGDSVIDAFTLAEVLVFGGHLCNAHVQALIQLSAECMIDLDQPLNFGEVLLFLSDPLYCHSFQLIGRVE